MNRKFIRGFLLYPAIVCLLMSCQAQTEAPIQTPTQAPTQAPAGVAAQATPDERIVAVARGVVESESGLLSVVAAPSAVAFARVSAVWVHEGDQVRAGQILVQLSDLNGKQAQILARSKLARAKLISTQAAKALTPARLRAQRLENVAKVGAGTRQASDDANAALAELTAQFSLANIDIQLAQAELDQLTLVEQELTIRAPVAGLIIDQNAKFGAAIANSTDALIVLLPDGPRRIRVQLNEEDIAVVKIGMRASVETQGDTSAKVLAAKVRWIAPIFRPTRATAEQAETGLQHVDCLLDIDAQTLRIGTQVIVRVAAN